MTAIIDVAIVGSGPAGASLAYHLASGGIEVALFDRATFPRYKTCAGGIQVKTADLLDFPLDTVIERTIREIRTTCKMADPLARRSDLPLICTVSREGFDAFLIEKAKQAGAVISQGERVTGVDEDREHVLVSTAKKQVKARLVAGADGALSIVRRRLYPNLRLSMCFGVEAEMEVGDRDLAALEETIVIDWGTMPGGYAWAFPKADHLSVGAGGPFRAARQVKTYFHSFVTKLEEEGVLRGPRIRRLSTHLLPTACGRSSFNTSRSLLVGDAAGLIDPLTGDGIYNALLSAQIAATTIIEHGGQAHPFLDPYTDQVMSRIMTEIGGAWSIMYLFNLYPRAFHHWVKRSDRLWRAMVRSLRGDKTYLSWRQELGPFQAFWPAIDFVSEGAARRRLRRLGS